MGGLYYAQNPPLHAGACPWRDEHINDDTYPLLQIAFPPQVP